MIALVARLLGVQTLAASLIVYASAAALLGGSLWSYGAWKHHVGYEAGEAHEKADWEERQRLARIAAAAEAKTKQADIDAAAQDYADQARTDDQHIADLEAALMAERVKANAEPPPSDGKPPACVGTPRGVSVNLDAIGR